jgi:hypothetical protein
MNIDSKSTTLCREKAFELPNPARNYANAVNEI